MVRMISGPGHITMLAFQVGRVPEPVISMDKTTLENTKGIGKSVAGKIVEPQSGRM